MTINVTSTADAVDPTPGDSTCDTATGPPANGACTLRAAVQTSNNGGPNTINLPAGTYQLTIGGVHESNAAAGDLNIKAPVTIVGAGQASTIVDGGGLDRVFEVLTGPVTMSGLTVRNGDAKGKNGGGIRSDGQLTLNNVTLSGNTTGGSPIAGNGGGVSQDAGGPLATQATLTGVTVTGNAARGCGGAAETGSLTEVDLRSSTISNNNATKGGGACDFGTGRLEVTDSTVTGNKACTTPTPTTCTGTANIPSTSEPPTAGGLIEEFGTLLVTRSTVDHNSSVLAGGIDEDGGGAVVVLSSTIASNQALGALPASNGGGIYEPGSGNMLILDSTFVNNHADHNGGAINTDGGGEAGITNVTFTGNSAGTPGLNGGGGGIANTLSDNVKLDNVTLQGNHANFGGGNLDNCAPGAGSCSTPIKVVNTIVAGGAPTNCANAITSLGHNLDDGTSCGFAASGDLSSKNPLLGPLASNGGPTQTLALLPGSPAIDAGDNADCRAADQRGVPRPQGGACDIGAYESAPPSATTGAPTVIGATSATLSGFGANPDAVGGTVVFQFGTTKAYGGQVGSQPITPGTPRALFTAGLSGLTRGTTYHYRFVVTNPDGTSFGADRTFRTVSNQFTIARVRFDRAGRIILTLTGPGPGSFSATATTRVKKGRKKRTIRYGAGTATSPGPGTVTLRINPKKKAKRALRRRKKLRVSVRVTFTPTGGQPNTKTTALRVRYKHKGG